MNVCGIHGRAASMEADGQALIAGQARVMVLLRRFHRLLFQTLRQAAVDFFDSITFTRRSNSVSPSNCEFK